MKSKSFRYSLFGSLYFVQGAIMGFFTALNAIYLLSFNVSMSQIGIMGMIAMIPFVIKIFLGMLSDKVNLLGAGYRKPYIIIGLFIQAICLMLVGRINPGKDFWLYALTAFILMMGMALYDTTTDGLALDTTNKEDEGTVQGIMVGARALGVVAISSVIGIMAEKASWMTVFWFLAAVTLIPLLLVFFVIEPERPVEKAFQWKAFSAFKYWPVIALGILGALYSLIINGANQIINPYLSKLFEFGPKMLGFYTTYWGLGVVAGSLLGGRLVDKVGQKKSVWAAMIVSMIVLTLFIILKTPLMAALFVVLFGIAFGYYETVYFAISMERSDPRIAASMFSILMAVANIGTGIGLALSGKLVDTINYPLTFLVFAAINLLALPLISAIFGKKRPASMDAD